MAAEPDLVVEVDLTDPERARLIAVGEVDVATRAVLDDAFARTMAAGYRRVDLDLEGTTFFDSSGVASIVGVVAAGAEVLVHRPRPMVRRVLALLVVPGLSTAD